MCEIPDRLSLSSYNIPGRLSSVGSSIFAHIVHEFKDGRDIQSFLSSSRCAYGVSSDPFFKWSVAPTLAQEYSLRTVPMERTEIVCLIWNPHVSRDLV